VEPLDNPPASCMVASVAPRARKAAISSLIQARISFQLLALSPSSIWKSSHNHHHNHNFKLRGSQIGSFPIMTKAQFLKSPQGKRTKYLFMRHPLTILFGHIFVFLYGMCIYPFLNHPRKHYDCLIAVVVHVVIGAMLTFSFGWQALLLTQLIPHFIACAVGSYMFYAQHWRTYSVLAGRTQWCRVSRCESGQPSNQGRRCIPSRKSLTATFSQLLSASMSRFQSRWLASVKSIGQPITGRMNWVSG
jgi:hypothetical protein